MKENINTILLGEGLGKLKFGHTREVVNNLLGEPQEIERYSYSNTDTDYTESWHYDDLELSLSFDESNNWTLSVIAVSGKGFTIEGESVMGKEKEEVLKTLKKLGIEDYEEEDILIDDEDDDTRSQLISFEYFNLNLWFENNTLTEIQFYPIVHEFKGFSEN